MDKEKGEGFGIRLYRMRIRTPGIRSPSTVFRDQVGSNLALGLGEGFEDEMKHVSRK